MQCKKAFFFAFSVSSVLGIGAAQADSLLIGGTEVSGHRSFYGQVGVVTALPGSHLGDGWVARGMVNGLTYKYQNNSRDIDANAVGGDLMLGYQGSGAPGWWAFYTGPTYRHTNLSPNDPTSDARGGNWGWLLQGEGEANLSQNSKLNLTGNYAIADNGAYWTRARFLWRISGNMFAGPEAVWQGDNDYNAWQLGAALVGIDLDPNAQLGLKAGMRKAESFSASPYGGVELGYKF